MRPLVVWLVDTSAVANWTPLRVALSAVENSVTFSWADLDSLVGGLPRSAHAHSAFWKGARSGWPGFTAVNVRIGDEVTFVRELRRQHSRNRRSG